VRIKTTYLGPTDTKGSRIRVRSMETGIAREFPYDYAARNPHTAAIRASFGPGVNIRYTGDHARGHWYDVT
jgi:hypothetical protein